MSAQEKKSRLQEILRSYGKVAIAYSSGVDSTFLLKIAHDVLGENAIAVTVKSNLVPSAEMDEAEAFCAREGIRHIFITHDEMSVPGFAENPANRCYICKRQIFSSIQAVAREAFCNTQEVFCAASDRDAHATSITVCEGSNKDDEGDYRPGMKAIAELSVKSPLREAGLTKAEIRELSRELNLATANKPSFACLASRIPYGQTITRKKLQLVENAEKFLQSLGFVQYRVRCKELATEQSQPVSVQPSIAMTPQSVTVRASVATALTASIELLPEQFELFKIHQETIVSKFIDLGFSQVLFDEKGYRTGSLNEVLSTKDKQGI